MVRFYFIFLFLTCLSVQSQVITLTTTSKSPNWSPQTVTKTGEPLTWTASATDMTDQIITTIGIPTFDLSVSRTGAVLITVIISDNLDTLTDLSINSLNINALDVSNAIYLTSLSCSDNQLNNLNTLNNTVLTELFCHTNQLNSLNLTNNIKLSTLACFSNTIINLNLSKNTLLKTLSCSFNLIKDLNLSTNGALITLECDNNKLTDLNIQNGNNSQMNIFNSTKNMDLKCIQVDDETADHSKWNIDSWTSYSNDCTFANRPPVANDNHYELIDNTELIVDAKNGILNNDTDHEGDELTAVLETDVNNGKLTLNSDGSFDYTPKLNFYGADQFTYKAFDSELYSNIATVILDVILINSPPVSNENAYTTTENTILEIDEKEGVLSNDSDADGDILTAHLIDNVKNGILSLAADGSFEYDPNTNFFGEDIFTYKSFDGFEYSSTTKVIILVDAIIEIVTPNAFSPNNDGINDTFRPIFKGFSNVRINIYDTWGNLIFSEEGEDLTGWNGLIKGNDAENGNYLYIITATTIDKQTKVYDGMLTLIK